MAPFLVESHLTSVRDMVLSKCQADYPNISFELCWSDRRQASLPFWWYLISYVPASALLWMNWTFKPNFQLTEQSYPKRTISVLMWLGIIVAACGAIFPIWNVASADISKINEIDTTAYWVLLRVFAAWLIAPLLFYHLVGPVSLASSMKKGKVALLFLAVAPIVALVLYILRVTILNM